MSLRPIPGRCALGLEDWHRNWMLASAVRAPLLAVLLGASLVGCSQPPPAPAVRDPSVGTSPLEAAFAEAAAEYQVPAGLLKSLAYVETRVDPKADRSPSGGRGLMQLVRRADWDTVSRAQALTGADEARLEVDAEANLRGAAAVLRELADKTSNGSRGLDARDAADFFHAVSLYAGLGSATLGADYAAEVYGALERGFTVQRPDGTVVQAPTFTEWRSRAPAGSRRDAVKEYTPAYQWLASPNFASGRSSYSYVVVHTTQGSYSGTLSWFQNVSSQVSAHYVVRSSDGQITQMVENADTAWHVQCYNSKAIGIEHEGFVADPGTWYTDAMYGESAKLTRWLCDRYGIPRDRSHVIAHAEVPASCNTNSHTDPGSGWNWTKYMALVDGAPSNLGTLSGVVYTGGNPANGVAGAKVSLGAQSLTTGADGSFEFSLNPGTYTVTASKAGFVSSSLTRTVVAGGTVSASLELSPVAATGTAEGNVYLFDPAHPADTSHGLAGAAVSAAGQTTMSDANGAFVLTLAPGAHTVTATKAGYEPASKSATVTAGGTVVLSLGLATAGAGDAQAPQLNVAAPLAGAEFDAAAVTVSGTASDDRGPVALVSLKLNGGAPSSLPVSNGAFSGSVKLAPGSNSLELSAADAAGNVASVVRTVVFHAGASGIVFLSGDEGARLSNLTVELRDGKGALAGTAQTSDDGSFAADVALVPADYVLVVRGPGFVTHSETVSVPADARVSVKVPMLAGADGESSGVRLVFSEPRPGAVVGLERLVVRGVVSGLEVVAVAVNGAAAQVLPEGQFVAVVPLVEGLNLLEAVATGTKGETVVATLHVTRDSRIIEGPGAAHGSTGFGCTGAPGAPLAWVLVVALAAHRRRQGHSSLR